MLKNLHFAPAQRQTATGASCSAAQSAKYIALYAVACLASAFVFVVGVLNAAFLLAVRIMVFVLVIMVLVLFVPGKSIPEGQPVSIA